MTNRRLHLPAALLLVIGFAGSSPAPCEPPPPGDPAASVRVATLLPYVGDAVSRADTRLVVVASVAPRSGAPLPEGVLDLGSPHAPNLEQLALSRPEIVVADARFHRSLTEPLSGSGARVVLVDGSSIESTLAGLREVGAAAGGSQSLDQLVETCRQQIEALRLADSPALLPLFGAPGSYTAITPRTWLGDLIETLGFDNVAAEVSGRESFPGYVQLSDEVLMTLPRATVVLVTHGSPDAVLEDFERKARQGGPWKRFAADVIVLDPDRFAANPGLDLPVAGAELIELVQAERPMP